MLSGGSKYSKQTNIQVQTDRRIETRNTLTGRQAEKQRRTGGYTLARTHRRLRARTYARTHVERERGREVATETDRLQKDDKRCHLSPSGRSERARRLKMAKIRVEAADVILRPSIYQIGAENTNLLFTIRLGSVSH